MGDGYGNIKDVMGFVPVQIMLCESFSHVVQNLRSMICFYINTFTIDLKERYAWRQHVELASFPIVMIPTPALL